MSEKCRVDPPSLAAVTFSGASQLAQGYGKTRIWLSTCGHTRVKAALKEAWVNDNQSPVA